MLLKTAKLYQRMDKSKFIEHPEYTTHLLCSDMALITKPVITFPLSGQQLLLLCKPKVCRLGMAVELRLFGYAATPHIWHNLCARFSDVLWRYVCHQLAVCIILSKKRFTCRWKLIDIIFSCFVYVYPTRFARGTNFLNWITKTTTIYVLRGGFHVALAMQLLIASLKKCRCQESCQMEMLARLVYPLHSFGWIKYTKIWAK